MEAPMQCPRCQTDLISPFPYGFITKRVGPVFIVGAISLLHLAMASATPNASVEPIQTETVIEHDSKAIRPLYSQLCEYKTVMNNEDMHRCGVFLNIGPLPLAMASATPNASVEPIQNETVIEHDKAIRPLYSQLCEYKTVMNNEDMHRCGVFLNIGPLPNDEVTRWGR